MNEDMLRHARLVVSIDSNGPQTAFSPEYVALCREVLRNEERYAEGYAQARRDIAEYLSTNGQKMLVSLISGLLP